MKSVVRNTHKYLSFFISLQLLLWTVSGIYFAFSKIELVRGEQYLASAPFSVDLSQVNLNVSDVTKLSLTQRLGKDVLVATRTTGKVYLDRSGEKIDKLSTDEAMQIVAKRTTLRPQEVEEISRAIAGSEYRGRSLPLYKVSAKSDIDEKINVYVNVFSGGIVAIRSPRWRMWDLLWGLHIIDWDERDNINNVLLQIFSILALISSITGLLLFFKVDIKKKITNP